MTAQSTKPIDRYLHTYQRIGGGEFTVERLHHDGVLFDDGLEKPFRAGDMLVTRHDVTPPEQWTVEADRWKKYYEVKI